MNRFKSTISGECHCDNISFEFKTNVSLNDIIVRNCQCRFCKAHGAATVRDPDGLASIKVRDPEVVTLYRFATKTTDFILCSICGVYIGAAITVDGRTYATLNMNATNLNTMNTTPIVHDNESGEYRVARRVNSFTPLTSYPF